ncbi:DUF6382 domain-containing protein [Cohnella pontilimi]|nr:DUF6382 domain-containing protein [Cohnella pontilimi]
MDRFNPRFERNRGHYLVIEGDPPIFRAECDEFQLRMLQTCEIPGLMRPDVEEMDGSLAFRFSLQGGRMLSQVMRAAKWSMADWMTVLCRLADILEESRLYLLDAARIRLDDDWIFVGEDWQELKMVYLPVPGAEQSLRDSLERLIIRWIVHVSELEGPAIQQVMQIVRSPDFSPASLRRYARGYLAEKAAGFAGGSIFNPEHERVVRQTNSESLLEWSANAEKTDDDWRYEGTAADETNDPPAKGWRWFRPSGDEPQQLSGLLGTDSAPFGREIQFEREVEPDKSERRRIWLICAAVGLIAVAWRAGFAAYPGKQGLLLSGGATLIILAGVIGLWNRQWQKDEDQFSRAKGGDWMRPRRPSDNVQPAQEGILPISESLDNRGRAQHTSALGSSWQADMTQQLEGASATTKKEAYYLDWESGSHPGHIPLQDTPVVIGRSPVAANHVDDGVGVSRAHVELSRTPEGWKAKDLGSRNGTRLNGTSMVPYESYLLQPEDCLDVAESKYRFKRSG